MPTVKELYDQITSQITPEQALMNMLKNSVAQYEAQKLNANGEPIHPMHIIALAAMDLGWQIAVKADDDENDVIGLTIGTEAYMNEVLKQEDPAV